MPASVPRHPACTAAARPSDDATRMGTQSAVTIRAASPGEVTMMASASHGVLSAGTTVAE